MCYGACTFKLISNLDHCRVMSRIIINKCQGTRYKASVAIFEPQHEKTGFLPMRKQRRRSAVQ